MYIYMCRCKRDTITCVFFMPHRNISESCLRNMNTYIHHSGNNLIRDCVCSGTSLFFACLASSGSVPPLLCSVRFG